MFDIKIKNIEKIIGLSQQLVINFLFINRLIIAAIIHLHTQSISCSYFFRGVFN